MLLRESVTYCTNWGEPQEVLDADFDKSDIVGMISSWGVNNLMEIHVREEQFSRYPTIYQRVFLFTTIYYICAKICYVVKFNFCC